MKARARLLFIAFVPCVLWLACPIAGHTADPNEPAPDIEVFTRAGCPHCAAAKLFLVELQGERPGLRVLVHDVGKDLVARERLKTLAVQHAIPAVGVPAFSLRGDLIIGFAGPDTTGMRIKALLDQPSAMMPGGLPQGACRPETPAPCERDRASPTPPPDTIDTPVFGRLSVRELGLPLFTFTWGSWTASIPAPCGCSCSCCPCWQACGIDSRCC